MTFKLYGYLNSGTADDEINLPDAVDELECFLNTLSNQILDPNEIQCPVVQPSENRNIRLDWSDKKYDNYVDVNLRTLKAEHRVVSDGHVVVRMYYDFSDSGNGWREFEKQSVQWIKRQDLLEEDALLAGVKGIELVDIAKGYA